MNPSENLNKAPNKPTEIVHRLPQNNPFRFFRSEIFNNRYSRNNKKILRSSNTSSFFFRKLPKLAQTIFDLMLPLRLEKAGRVWCGGARETQ